VQERYGARKMPSGMFMPGTMWYEEPGKAGIAINLVDGPETMALLKQIEDHFGKKINHLDAEDVDEIEKLEQE
jgi:hypothetical protein